MVVLSDTSDGVDGEIDALFPAGLHDLPVAFETEDRAETLFRRGVRERSQTDVVYLLTKTVTTSSNVLHVPPMIFE